MAPRQISSLKTKAADMPTGIPSSVKRSKKQEIRKKKAKQQNYARVMGPVHNQSFMDTFPRDSNTIPTFSKFLVNPKSTIANYARALHILPEYQTAQMMVNENVMYRSTILADPGPPPPPNHKPLHPSMSLEPMPAIIGTGDDVNPKEAERLAAYHACLLLEQANTLASNGLPDMTRRTVVSPSTEKADKLLNKSTENPVPINNASHIDAEMKTETPPQNPNIIYNESFMAAFPRDASETTLFSKFKSNPKSILANYMSALDLTPKYVNTQRKVNGTMMFRSTVLADPGLLHAPTHPLASEQMPPIIGTGDDVKSKEAEKLAALHACLLLEQARAWGSNGLPDMKRRSSENAIEGTNELVRSSEDESSSPDTVEDARAFLDFYCQRFSFSKPVLNYTQAKPTKTGDFTAILLVQDHRIGFGSDKNKKSAQTAAYIDALRYLRQVDPQLWTAFLESKQRGGHNILFEMNKETEAELKETVYEAHESILLANAETLLRQKKSPKVHVQEVYSYPNVESVETQTEDASSNMTPKSQELFDRLVDYKSDPALNKIRNQRAELPVHKSHSSILAKIKTNPTTVLVASTGSGKTTQVPQIILDDWISAGKGEECNIICTQPRRIAAISVAERVASERGEPLGQSVGYQVRFESVPPAPGGSILFCTIGLFLRRLQNGLGVSRSDEFLDKITHVLVDEVHERDVDTDLLLFVLRRIVQQRQNEGKPEIKIVLMSATIDPTSFTTYFSNSATKLPAPVMEVEGRSFPVEKIFLDDIVEVLQSRTKSTPKDWVWKDKSVVQYLQRELVPRIPIDEKTGKPVGAIDNLGMPYPLIALLISYVLAKSTEGHVLVFLPGWEEIQAVRDILLDRRKYPLEVNFNSSQFEICILHSSVPTAEQQLVFQAAPEGVRRIVLSTNIAETSVTIPDIVYVVDSAKCKEKRYDPERRLSQLVSAWTGSSNVLQRAGRAGRHRPGEFFGVISKARFDTLELHQTVEMLRTDLASTCMHITGLGLPGLSVEDVLSDTIQPPEHARILDAMKSLRMVGAIDETEQLTSLGRVLLHLPVDAAIGKLCLLGSFFKCLDQALTLAAILTNRDPFLSPPLLKAEARRVKETWAPFRNRSDPLTTLLAYNEWWSMQSRGQYVSANAFASNNFLSKPTLVLISKIKDHLAHALDRAGVLQVSGAGRRSSYSRGPIVIPAHLNVNGNNFSLLSALISAATAPNIAVQVSKNKWKTSQDKSCQIHSSSVNAKQEKGELSFFENNQIYSYGEKIKAGNNPEQSGGQMFLRSTTLIDPLGFLLFGASKLKDNTTGLLCDDWLPVLGDSQMLDDVVRLRIILDKCLLRVFEGLGVTIRNKEEGYYQDPRDQESDGENEDEDETRKSTTMSKEEIEDLSRLTRGVVNAINLYDQSRGGGLPVAPSCSELPVSRNARPPSYSSSNRTSRPTSQFNSPSISRPESRVKVKHRLN